MITQHTPRIQAFGGYRINPAIKGFRDDERFDYVDGVLYWKHIGPNARDLQEMAEAGAVLEIVIAPAGDSFGNYMGNIHRARDRHSFWEGDVIWVTRYRRGEVVAPIPFERDEMGSLADKLMAFEDEGDPYLTTAVND